MTKVKEFLKELEKNDGQQYFRLYRFYKNPKSSLGGDEEETLEKYYEFGDIKYFILNNTFFEFLELCLEEKEFREKLNLNLLRKIRYILFDSKDFQKEYFAPLEDQYLRDWCNNKVPIGPIYGRKYNGLELLGISDLYEKYGGTYEMGIDNERFNNLNTDLIDRLCLDSTYDIDIYIGKYIEPQEQRKNLFERIKSDDYSSNFNCILTSRSAFDRKIFLNLVCDNEFLKIEEEVLLEKELSNIVIKHIIDILEVSIHFKKMYVDKYEDFWIHYNQLGKEKINVYDYQRAEYLISLLESKKNKKIIRFRNSN